LPWKGVNKPLGFASIRNAKTVAFKHLTGKFIDKKDYITPIQPSFHRAGMARQRYVRRQPWTERILGFINIYDHFLALTTELDSYDVDPQAVGLPIAVVLNVLAFLAAANSGGTGWSDSDVLMVPDGRGGYTIPGRNNLGVFVRGPICV
jgi:hypothetical protein